MRYSSSSCGGGVGAVEEVEEDEGEEGVLDDGRICQSAEGGV